MSQQALRGALQNQRQQEQNRMPTILLASSTSRSQLTAVNLRLVPKLIHREAANMLMIQKPVIEGPRCKSLLRRLLRRRGQALLPMR